MSAAVDVEQHTRMIRAAVSELDLQIELELGRFERESGLVPVAVPVDPDEGTDPDLPVLRGKARITVAGAFLDLLTAVNRAQAVADALARALDATTKGGTP